MKNSLPHVVAVMVHVPVPAEELAWYQSAFPGSVHKQLEGQGFEYIEVGNVRIEVVQADSKVSSGAAGSVVYWRVANLDAFVSHLQGLGATLYRGPMPIEDNLHMCQVRDPWGNCIGLRGPRSNQVGRQDAA